MANINDIWRQYVELNKSEVPSEDEFDMTGLTAETPAEPVVAPPAAPEVAAPEATPEASASEEAPVSARKRLETYLAQLEKGGGKDRNTAQWVDAINSINQGLRASMGMKPVGQAPSAESALDRKQNQKLTSLAQLAKLEEKPKAAQPKLMSLPQGVVAISPDDKGGFKSELIAKAEPKVASPSEQAKIDYYKARAEQSKTATELMKPSFELKKEKQASTLSERDELKSSEVKSLTEKAQLIGKLNNAIGKLNPKNLGPVQGRMDAAFATYGGRDADAQVYRGKMGRILAEYIKTMSGTAVSDKEREFLSSLVPSTRMTPPVFKSILADFKNEIKDAALIELDQHQANRQDVSKIRNNFKSLTGEDYYSASPFKPEAKRDPNIENYANQYNLSYEQADSILRKRGYGQK